MVCPSSGDIGDAGASDSSSEGRLRWKAGAL